MRRLPTAVSAVALAVLTGSLFASVAFAAGGAKIGLRPVHFDPARPATNSYFVFDAAPSQTIHDQVQVLNTGTDAGTVRLYAVDATTGQTSGAVYLTDEYPRKDVGAWISLDQREITLKPGEEQTVPFTVTVPADASAGQHLGGLVAEDEALTASKTSSNLQVNLRTRMITAVQVNLPGPVTEKVTVTGLTAGGEHGHQTLVVGLRNDGTDLVKPTGTLTVTDAHGQVVQRVPLQLDTFLPRTAIQYPVDVQKQALGAGQYQAQLALTYGSKGKTSYQTTLNVTPQQVAQTFKGAAPLSAPPTAASATTPDLPSATIALGGIALALLLLPAAVLLRRRRRAG